MASPTDSKTLNETVPPDPALDAEAKPKALPALPPADGSTQIEVNGATVKLDSLGPMVVNQDGTLSRIANWEQMTDMEKRNTLRVLAKRNQLRLAALRGEDKNTDQNKSEF